MWGAFASTTVGAPDILIRKSVQYTHGDTVKINLKNIF